MVTTARYNVYRKVIDSIVCYIDSTKTYFEGDPLYFDKALGQALPLTDDAKVPLYCGIALATNPVAHHPKPITKMAVEIGDVICKFYMPSGEAIAHMTPVFVGSDTQHVTTVEPGGAGNGHVLGYVIMDAEEGKKPRTTTADEEVSILMVQSVFKTRAF